MPANSRWDLIRGFKGLIIENTTGIPHLEKKNGYRPSKLGISAADEQPSVYEGLSGLYRQSSHSVQAVPRTVQKERETAHSAITQFSGNGFKSVRKRINLGAGLFKCFRPFQESVCPL